MPKRSLKQHLILAGSLLGTAGFLVRAVMIQQDIQRSTISTAAIGYLFLPLMAAIAALPALLAGLCLGYALFYFRQSPTKAAFYKPVVALVCAVGLLAWQGKAISDELNTPLKVEQVEALQSLESLQKLLDQQKTEKNIYVLGAIAMNPRTTGAMLDQIAHIDEPDLQDKMVGYGKNRKGLAVMRLVAKHANVYPQTLEFLANSTNEYVRSSVAANAKLSPRSLRRLASEHNYLIDWSLAANAATPVDILKQLAESKDIYTRRGLVSNPTTPVQVIEFLAHDAESFISQEARTRLAQGETRYFGMPEGKVGSP